MTRPSSVSLPLILIIAVAFPLTLCAQQTQQPIRKALKRRAENAAQKPNTVQKPNAVQKPATNSPEPATASKAPAGTPAPASQATKPAATTPAKDPVPPVVKSTVPATKPTPSKSTSKTLPDTVKPSVNKPATTAPRQVVPAVGSAPVTSQSNKPAAQPITPAAGTLPSAPATRSKSITSSATSPAAKSSLPPAAIRPGTPLLTKPAPRLTTPPKRTTPPLPSNNKSVTGDASTVPGQPSPSAVRSATPPAGTKTPKLQAPQSPQLAPNTAKKTDKSPVPSKPSATQTTKPTTKKPATVPSTTSKAPKPQSSSTVAKPTTPPKTTTPATKPSKSANTTKVAPSTTPPATPPTAAPKPESLVPQPLVGEIPTSPSTLTVPDKDQSPNLANKAAPATEQATSSANKSLPVDKMPAADPKPMPAELVESVPPPAANSPQPTTDELPAPASPPVADALPQIATESAPWLSAVDLAIGLDGSFFVADRKLPAIWRMKDGQTTTIHKGPRNPKAPMGAVRSLFVAADGTLFAGDAATKEVYSVSLSGEVKALSRNSIGIPNSISVVGGTVYVADIEQQKIWTLPAEGLGIAQQPTQFADVPGCRGLFIDELGFIWVVSTIQPQLRKYTGDGKFEPVFEDVVFEFPQQVCVTIEGTAYVTDSAAKAVWKVERGGQPEKWLTGHPLQSPTRIIQQGSHFIVSDSKANSLFRVAGNSTIELMIVGSAASSETPADATSSSPTSPPAGTNAPN